MSKVYLFSDISEPFALQLAKKFSENGDAVWGISSDPLPTDNPDSVSFRNIHAFPGTPGSSLSVVSFFRKVLNEHEKIDTILFFGLPVRDKFSVTDSGKLYFENLIDRKIKNMMFFLSEGIKQIRQGKAGLLAFIDYFEFGADNMANTLWKHSFCGMADRMCMKPSVEEVPAELYRLKNEKPDQAAVFVADHFKEEGRTFPSVYVSEDKKSRGLFGLR